jgi:hypothetical protein
VADNKPTTASESSSPIPIVNLIYAPGDAKTKSTAADPQPSAVVPFVITERNKPEKRPASSYAVTQHDLEELLYLERQAKDGVALWRIKKDTILTNCSPGIRHASMILRSRKEIRRKNYVPIPTMVIAISMAAKIPAVLQTGREGVLCRRRSRAVIHLFLLD